MKQNSHGRTLWQELKYRSLTSVLRHLNAYRQAIRRDGSEPEQLYRDIYLKKILSQISENCLAGRRLRIVDGGCGTGQIAVRLAQAGHDVTGIDCHRASLVSTQANADKAGIQLNLIQGDLLKCLNSMESGSYDIGVCLEVLYTCVDYNEIIREFSRVMRTAGLFIAAFRSKFYFITTLLAQGQYDQALYVAKNSEGVLKIASVPTYYNWQSMEQIRQLFVNNHLTVPEIIPIGMFSGMGCDGMAAIADIEKIPKHAVDDVISKLEGMEFADYKGVGRYLLAIGKKQGGPFPL